MGEGQRTPEQHHRNRAIIAGLQSGEEERGLKAQKRYGGNRQADRTHGEGDPHSHFGITIVSCEHGDIRLVASVDGDKHSLLSVASQQLHL